MTHTRPMWGIFASRTTSGCPGRNIFCTVGSAGSRTSRRQSGMYGPPLCRKQKRFMQHKVTIRAGDTVEWAIGDSITPHTITFGTEPEDVVDPSANVIVDSDGARHAIINSISDKVHSGFIQTAPQDRIGLAQAPLGATRFKVTFTKSGIYHYKCASHDGLGMKETVVVLP
jgi:plastocyanin